MLWVLAPGTAAVVLTITLPFLQTCRHNIDDGSGTVLLRRRPVWQSVNITISAAATSQLDHKW